MRTASIGTIADEDNWRSPDTTDFEKSFTDPSTIYKESKNIDSTEGINITSTFCHAPQEVKHEEICNELTGIILGVNGEYVNVKLGHDLTVNFPKVLFNEGFLKFGQPVKYRIKLDERGYRYQEFIPCKDTRNNR